MRPSVIASSALLLASSLAMLSGCASAQAATATPTVASETTTTSTQVAGDGSKAKAGNRWEELHKGSSPDVKVHWPDGHTTVGLDKHFGELDGMFAFAPDMRIDPEPTKTANGEWTTVVRVASGTFTQPLVADGKTVAPNGKPFKIWIATITHNNGSGLVDEEYLFWNDKTLKSQIGI